MRVRHFFPGGNTAGGFFNAFGGITAPWDKNQRVYILKGGPGVGKNTLMREFAQRALAKDYSVDYFHCASDEDSLDGVRVPEKELAIIDGTAPHVIDPVLPGAADGIINLGIFLDEKKTKRKKMRDRKTFRGE